MTTPDWSIDTSRYEFKVSYVDTDLAGAVYHTKYLEQCERARGKFFDDIGLGQEKMAREHKIAFAVVHNTIDFHAPARFADVVHIETKLIDVSGVRLSFEQRIYSKATLLVTNQVTLAGVDVENYRPLRVPEQLRDALCSAKECV